MRWEVRGADASSGDDRLMVVEGRNSEEVEAKARYSGMLVASITPVVSTAPVVAYALPQQQAAEPAASQPRAPSDHATLRIGARVLQVTGIVVTLAGVLFIAVGIRTTFRGNTGDGIFDIAVGLLVFVAGIAAHVFASVSLVVGDIAGTLVVRKSDEPVPRDDDSPPST